MCVQGTDGMQAAAAKYMRTAIFRVIVQRVAVFSESVRNYHYTLRNDPEEGISRKRVETAWASDGKI